MNDTTKAAPAIDTRKLADEIVTALASKLSADNAVIINQLPAPDDQKNNLARDALAAARSFGSDAIRTAFIVNGGALTAILAYLGSESAPEAALHIPMLAFALGAIAAVGAAVCAYLAQSSLADQYRNWNHDAAYPTSHWSRGAVALLAFSAGLSVVGAIGSFCELSNVDKSQRTTLEVKLNR